MYAGLYYDMAKSAIQGTFEIRYRGNGRPFVAITKENAEKLSKVSKSWKIEQDVLDESVYIKPDKDLFTNGVHPKRKTKISTIRVDEQDWEDYVALCRSLGTSTCREIRLFIHLKLEEARYPATKHRSPGVY